MQLNKPVYIVLTAVLLSLALHFKIFSYDLIGYHVWRQTQTQTVIQNFYEGDMNIFNPRVNTLEYPDGIMRMEFPLYQWLVALVCKITHQPVLTARIASFVIGVLSVFGFSLLVRKLTSNNLLAALGGWAFMFSPVFYYYMVNPLPDNLALCFGIFALVFFLRYRETNSIKHLCFYAVFLCMAALIKLPFILFGTPLLVSFFRRELDLKRSLLTLSILLPAGIWYAAVIGTWQDHGTLEGVFHGEFDLLTYLDYIQHNFISTLPELYINYAALLLFGAGVYYAFKNKVAKQRGAANYFMWTLLAVIGYTLFELNMIAKVHDYYLFPYLPFLYLLIMYGFKQWFAAGKPYLRALALVCILLTPLAAYLRCNTRWNMEHTGFNRNLMIHQKEIQQLIPPQALCLTGLDDSRHINLYYLHRKGFTFYNDTLDVLQVKRYQQKGVSYVVSDAINASETENYLGVPLGVFGDIKVYKLK